MMDWIFFGPAKLMAAWPLAGVTIAAVLIGTQAALTARAGRPFGKLFFREAAVFAGLLWLIFGFYEMQVAAALTTPAANAGKARAVSELFRLDLIVLVPILYLLTAFALWALFQQLRNTK